MERKRDYMTVQELTENEKYKFWYFKIKECKESGLSVKDFCDKNNIFTIEGNSNDECKQNVYQFSSNVIYGYGVLAY